MPVKNIVLVHGAWGDGSHWSRVIPQLAGRGYTVTAVQNPLSSLDDDIHRTRTLLDAQDGPALLVGHSYGGAVISGAGHAPATAGLVFIAAFAPDEGENLDGLLARDGDPIPEGFLQPDSEGYLWIDFDAFHDAFAQDVDDTTALVMARAQKPIAGRCFEDKAGRPAWRDKPSWYQVSSRDRMIPPVTQAWFADRMGARGTITLDASHASAVSQPDAVAAFIDQAAQAL
jgi:pimeloyl-ACP methyl ester carboxylesterase